MRKILLPVLLVVMSFAYPRIGGVITIAVSTEIRTIDPIYMLSDDEKNIARQVFEPLMQIDERGNPMPNLVESWTIDDTGTAVLITLREDVRFHNGTIMTAKDVKFSLERYVNPALNPQKSWVFSLLKGSAEYRNGKAEAISGITIIADNKILFELVQPYASFLNILSTECGYVLPAGVENLQDYSQIIGSGPFMIEDWNYQSIRLVRNPRYFKGHPFIDKLVFTQTRDVFDGLLKFELGDIDLYKIPYSELQRLKNDTVWSKQIIEQTRWGLILLGFNLRSPKVKPEELRRGLFMAIDREDLNRRLTSGRTEIARWLIPDELVPHNDEDWFGFDLLTARDLVRRTPGPRDFVLAIPANDQYVRSLAEIIKTQARAAEVNLIIREYPFPEYFQVITAGRCDLFLFTFNAFAPHPDAFLFPLFHSSGINTGYNLCGLDDPEIDDDLRRARLGGRGYEAIEKKILNRQVVMPLLQPQDFWVKQSYVQNFNFQPLSGISLSRIWILRRDR